MDEITSAQNPKIKLAESLKERRERDKLDLFIIEGYREILRAHEAGRRFETLFYCPPLFLGENEDDLIHAIGENKAFRCNEKVFRKLSYRDRPDGLVGIAKQSHLKLDDLKLSSKPFLVVAEAIEKPGNLGTILRSSDAVKVDGVIVVDRCTDIHNPNVVRASVGTLFTIPVMEAKGVDALKWMKKQGIQLVATTPKAEKEYTQVDLTGPIAIVVGTEQVGLTDTWLNEADIQVRIPMLGAADSLNVATATTLMLYEVLRQRSLRR